MVPLQSFMLRLRFCVPGMASVFSHLPAWVAVVIFVLVPQCKLLWERPLDHFVGHLLAHTLEKNPNTKYLQIRDLIASCGIGHHAADRVDFVEYLPLFVGDGQFLGCLYGASQLARPHLQVRQLMLLNEPPQGPGKLN